MLVWIVSEWNLHHSSESPEESASKLDIASAWAPNPKTNTCMHSLQAQLQPLPFAHLKAQCSFYIPFQGKMLADDASFN